jgi:hypothetical protein
MCRWWKQVSGDNNKNKKITKNRKNENLFQWHPIPSVD